jgi:hypothetical protein
MTTSSAEPAIQTRDLPSGRSVVLRFGEGEEVIEVRSPTGDLEVCIVLTEAGPVVQLRGARLQLEAPESIEVACQRFAVHTTQATDLTSAGEIRVQATGDVDIQGKLVKLNC